MVHRTLTNRREAEVVRAEALGEEVAEANRMTHLANVGQVNATNRVAEMSCPTVYTSLHGIVGVGVGPKCTLASLCSSI